MMVTDFRYSLYHIGDRINDVFRYVRNFIQLDRSPTSQIGHQHGCNLEITLKLIKYAYLRKPKI